MRPLAGGRRMDGTDYKVKTPPSQHHEGRWELTEHLDHSILTKLLLAASGLYTVQSTVYTVQWTEYRVDTVRKSVRINGYTVVTLTISDCFPFPLFAVSILTVMEQTLPAPLLEFQKLVRTKKFLILLQGTILGVLKVTCLPLVQEGP